MRRSRRSPGLSCSRARRCAAESRREAYRLRSPRVPPLGDAEPPRSSPDQRDRIVVQLGDDERPRLAAGQRGTARPLQLRSRWARRVGARAAMAWPLRPPRPRPSAPGTMKYFAVAIFRMKLLKDSASSPRCGLRPSSISSRATSWPFSSAGIRCSSLPPDGRGATGVESCWRRETSQEAPGEACVVTGSPRACKVLDVDQRHHQLRVTSTWRRLLGLQSSDTRGGLPQHAGERPGPAQEGHLPVQADRRRSSSMSRDGPGARPVGCMQHVGMRVRCSCRYQGLIGMEWRRHSSVPRSAVERAPRALDAFATLVHEAWDGGVSRPKADVVARRPPPDCPVDAPRPAPSHGRPQQCSSDHPS